MTDTEKLINVYRSLSFSNQKIHRIMAQRTAARDSVNFCNRDDGKAIAILSVYPDGRTDFCPFCGLRHLHGATNGHRVAHCLINGLTIETPGGLLNSADGYFLQLQENKRLVVF